MELERFRFIDSLRGIAILMVLMLHVGQQGADYYYFPSILQKCILNGRLGVQLFFMVSAFTLMLSYNNRKQTTDINKNFFIRRVFRIAPMYYLAILYFTFQNIIGPDYFQTHQLSGSLDLGQLISNIFFIHGIHPHWINSYVPGGWSITVEMTFYLSLPFICSKIKDINGSIYLLIGSLLFASLIKVLFKDDSFEMHQFLFMYFPNQLPVFALGIVASFIYKDGTSSMQSRTFLILTATAFIYSYITFPYHLFYSLFFFLLLITLSKKPYRLAVNRVTVYLGKISYSIYLVHFALLFWMARWNIHTFITPVNFTTALLDFFLRYLLLLLPAILISHFTYHYIEFYFQKKGQQLIHRRKKIISTT